MKEKLQKLIDAGKLKEAFELFKDDIIKKPNKEDVGQIYTHLLEAYVDAVNSINAEEAAELEEIQKILQEILSMEKKLAGREIIKEK